MFHAVHCGCAALLHLVRVCCSSLQEDLAAVFPEEEAVHDCASSRIGQSSGQEVEQRDFTNGNQNRSTQIDASSIDTDRFRVTSQLVRKMSARIGRFVSCLKVSRQNSREVPSFSYYIFFKPQSKIAEVFDHDHHDS